MELENKLLFEEFDEILEKEDGRALQFFLNEQNLGDIAIFINENPNYGTLIIEAMPVHRAAMVFKILDFAIQKTIIRSLLPAKTAELLNALPADDRTDFLEDLPDLVVRDLIKLLNPEERKITLSLLGYPEDSVGRMMTPDYVYVYAEDTIAEVFSTIRKYAKNSETIDVIYVINDKGELMDDIRIRDIILAAPATNVQDLMDGRVVALNVHDDQEYANQVFKMNNRVALPVTDDKNRLMGIVTIDDMLWVANEEFSEDMIKMGGTEALKEPYLDIPLIKLFQKRVGWLTVLFLGEMFTATAMGYFQYEIEKAVVLALFVPLIISSGGNSGSQASTLIIQAMSVGDVNITDWWRVMKREILSGILLGSVLGILGFARVSLWHLAFPSVYGPYWLTIGIAVGVSLLGVVLWGTLTGSMFPLLLKKLGADPAVSSAPFVATLVDVTGLLIYFSIAFLLLKGTLL